MNASDAHPRSVVDEQAASWAARLDGGVLDTPERLALEVWLAEDPAHRAALSDYCQLSADLEERLPELVATGAFTLPPPFRGQRRWMSPYLVALTAAAAAAIVVVTSFTRPAPEVQNVATAVAQRHALTLADGTRVELNAHTSLRFENSPDERRVRLGSGEALFSVAQDARRPFIVETPNGSVRVTGTVFNVRHEAAGTDFEVTVVEGSVQVRPNGSTETPGSGLYSLGKDEQLTAGPGGVAVRMLTRDAVENTLAWREGAVVFDGVPLHLVAARFGRYHGRRISVSPAVANESVGGRLGLDDFAAFLAALELALPVKVSYDLNGAVSIAPRTGS